MTRAAVIGAGPAGLCAAIKLIEIGVTDIAILERTDGPGGTWRANSYPGAACDAPSHLYSFSFAPKRDWSRKFAAQPEILAYYEALVDRYDLRRRIRFGLEVVSARFDDQRAAWDLTLSDGTTESAEVVVSAVGQLSRPAVPEIDGLASFAGRSFHSAEWDHSFDLTGKRVAVIGNGASAVQFVPPVAEQAATVTIFQRSANWIMPKPDREFTRSRASGPRTSSGSGSGPAVVHLLASRDRFLLTRKGSRLGQLLARTASDRLTQLASDRLPVEALVPDYPPGCKRILLSNDYYAALRRPSVEVELDPIHHVEADAVVTRAGRRHEADVIILGTGFNATDFLLPMEVFGRGGISLSAAWEGGAQAYLGVEIAGFPNFFVMYGPNTNLGNNSILFMIEAQARYVQRAVRQILEDDLDWIAIRPDVMDAFNRRIGAAAAKTVWAADCSNWYKNQDGVVTNNWPAPSSLYWLRMRSYRPHDHLARARPPSGAADLGASNSRIG